MVIELTSVKVNVKGKLDLKGLFGLNEPVPSGYKSIRFEAFIESPANEESIRTLVEIVEAHCPVMDTLIRPMSISGVAKLDENKVFFSPVVPQK